MKLSDSHNGERPTPREVSEIFEDLRVLAQSDGALHSISSIIYRDWVLTVDMEEGKVVDDAEQRWSTTKLNKNELLLLVGLTVQSRSPRTFSVLPHGEDFLAKADRLLREFHDILLMDLSSQFDVGKAEFAEGPEALSAVAREAIYYGAESFYLHQFMQFSRHRYRQDVDWLLRNVGLSIRPMLDVASFIVNRINLQMTYAAPLRSDKNPESLGALTNSLLISKDELVKKFGQKADAYICKYSTSAVGANNGFTSPFTINQVSTAPLVDIGDHLYVSNLYRLAETIYESPFYWMMADKAYRNIEADHRGAFLERTAAHLLRSVFGAAHVYENVTIRRSRKEIAGEADVLVVYGEFVIVVQAKSKRVTLKARAGDVDALKADFEGAIQAPYRQAYDFAEFIRAGAEGVTKDGRVLTFLPTVRTFPAVILSDGFPAATFLSGFMLERSEGIAPVIWDIGVLDCVARILPTPIDFLFYLKCRSDAFENIRSDSEYNFLGYHLEKKLVLPPDVDWMIIERDFATIVDDYMIASDVGIDRERPVGILERLEIPVVSDLLKSLKKAPPQLASVVIDLYDFSSAGLNSLSKQVLSLREEVAEGKELKAFSLLTESGGLTYVTCRSFNAKVRAAAHAIGAKHKYDSKRDRWYVIVDSIETLLPVDALLPIIGKWEEDVDLAENSRRVAELFRSRRQEIIVGEEVGESSVPENDDPGN